MKIIKRFLSCLIVILIVFVFLYRESEILELKNSYRKYASFFEHSEDIDVLFLGTSHIINGVFPMELWDEYGITSYNFGGHSQRIPTSYWALRNALEYSDPKVVVIDGYCLEYMQKTAQNISYLHLTFDEFPLSRLKILAINDLLDDDAYNEPDGVKLIEGTEKRDKLSLLFPFSLYHQRWNEITSSDDFIPSFTPEYGAESRMGIGDPVATVPNNGNTLPNETVGMIYLRKMIEECRNRDIQVLLIDMPQYVRTEEEWQPINTMAEIAEEYGLNYINFNDLTIVDYDTDFWNRDHLNIAGGMKVTHYLGQYICENYEVSDHRSEEKYGYWNDDYLQYEQSKNAMLSDLVDLNLYINMLIDDNYWFYIKTNNNDILSDPIIVRLLEDKGINASAISEDTRYVMVRNGTSVVSSVELNQEEASMMETYYEEDADIVIWVFDSDTDTLVDIGRFDSTQGVCRITDT